MWETLAALAAGAALFCAVQWWRTRRDLHALEYAHRTSDRHTQHIQLVLRTLEGRFYALLNTFPEAVLLLAGDLTVLALNPAARQVFGGLATPGQTLLTATRSAELDELAQHTLAGGEDTDRQVLFNSQPYRVVGVRVEGPSTPPDIILVLLDQSELQRLGRSRRDFIANISHELRTPLTSIRLVVDSLLAGVARAPDDTQTLLQKINAYVSALEHMAQELLDLAQIESGQAMVRLIPTSLHDLVQRAADRLRPQLEHKQHRLKLEVPAELQVLADAEQLGRVLANLLQNANKFTPVGGEISVRGYRRNGDIWVEVADTGPGIPPQDLPRVFERFFRGDRSRASGGTGLGLAIAKHVVEAHGGTIIVQSGVKPNEGARFSFSLVPADE